MNYSRFIPFWTVLALACGAASEPAPDHRKSDAGISTQDAGQVRELAADSGTQATTYTRPSFCARGARDALALLFCKSEAPEIQGMASLRKALSLSYGSMLAHSTGLNGSLVSTINPRIILRDGGSLGGTSRGFVALAFVRGVQNAEVMAYDPYKDRLNLYLIEFSQACRAAEGGCRPGDLYTPAIEEDWLELRVQDDEELKNTPNDCRRCHGGAPDEPGPMVLMRELRPPWAHWFTTSSTLRTDFLAAKRDPSKPGTEATEAYAGTTLINVVDPGGIEQTIERAEGEGQQPVQPLAFASAEIGFETGDRAGNGLLSQVRGNKRSPTWQALYDAFLAGLAPAPPNQYEHVPDAQKLQARASEYQAFLAGRLQKAELPDLADIFPDDPQRRAEIGLETEPGAPGEALLRQGCAPCHNQNLDQTVSRARFDVVLKRSGTAGIERAIERLELNAEDELRMPPAGARRLNDDARRTLIDYLRRQRNP